MTGRTAILQLRLVTAVLERERLRGHQPEGLRERAAFLIDQAAAVLDGSTDGHDALGRARRELALIPGS